MNGRLLSQAMGKLMTLQAALMLPAMGVALIYREAHVWAFLYSALILLAVGLPLWRLSKPRVSDIRPKEGFVLVALAWLVLSGFGALPFMFSGAAVYYWDALFESVSGITTTGASVFSSVKLLSQSLLFWRSFQHWEGGMGVLVMTLAVMPKLTGRGSVLARAESPGPMFNKFLPRMKDAAKFMYLVYMGLSLALLVGLLACGLPLYDAVIHTLSTAGTGGFSNRDLSIGHYQNPWAEAVVLVFMFLFSLNFLFYFRLLRGEGKKAFANEELRVYTLIAIAATVMVTLEILPRYGQLTTALRHAGFQVVSIMSSTGYATVDYTLWPQFSHLLMLVLMMMGASSGSTAGGIKVVRVVLLGKAAGREVSQTLFPRRVKVVKLDNKTVPEEILRGVVIYFFIYIAFLFVGSALASLDGHDFVTCFSATASCLSNMAPGLGLVGPLGNYGIFSPGVKLLMSFMMLAGRLEFIPMLALFHPGVWRSGQ